MGKRTSIELCFGRVFSPFSRIRLPRALAVGWSAVATQVALVYTATAVVRLADQHAHRQDLIRSPTRVLAHLWEDVSYSRAR